MLLVLVVCMLGQLALTAAAVALWRRRPIWSAGWIAAGLGLSLGLPLSVSYLFPFSHQGWPANQCFLFGICVGLTVALVSGRRCTVALSFIMAFGIANVLVAGTLIGRGYTAWPRGQQMYNSGKRAMIGFEAEKLLRGAPPSMLSQSFDRGPVPLVVLAFLKGKDPGHFGAGMIEEVSESRWHTWLTGLYQLRATRLVLIYPGGRLRAVLKERSPWTLRPQRVSRGPN